jgi:hypothetical protein
VPSGYNYIPCHSLIPKDVADCGDDDQVLPGTEILCQILNIELNPFLARLLSVIKNNLRHSLCKLEHFEEYILVRL